MGTLDLNQFKEDGDRQEQNPYRVQDLKDRLNSYALELLEYLLPGGRKKGNEYLADTIEGGAGKSTSISLVPGKIGVGADFNGGQPTGDLIDVYMASRNVDFKTALMELEAWVGLTTFLPQVDNPTIITSNLLPAGITFDNIPTSESTLYTYMDYNMSTLLTIRRVVHPSGKKDFYPELPDGSKTLPDTHRPLYNLPGINGAKCVVIVEGEKVADFLISLGIVATTCIGGNNAPLEKTDWSPLEGKMIILWADNDDGGFKLMRGIFDLLKTMDTGIISIVQPPRNAPDKWDAADCTPKQVEKLLVDAKLIHRPVNLHADEFSAKSYDEHPPKREYLLENGFALNSCSILAAEGGTGKSFMFLDLAVKIAFGTIYQDEAFGSKIQQNGNVIYFSAEDGRPDIHERINLVDIARPPRRFKDSKYDLKIIPMPSLGVTFPLFYMKDSVLTESSNWSRIRESILEMDDVKLIILDPLSMLVHADVNADPSMGSLVMAEFNRLAVETGSSVLISHHFSKSYDVAIESAEQARMHVRGTTALVDSARNVFCIWKATESQAKKSLEGLGEPFRRNRIFMGATVKSNYLTEDALKVLKKNEDTGVLECVETQHDSRTAEERNKEKNALDYAVREAIRRKAKQNGKGVKKTGVGSLDEVDLHEDHIVAIGRNFSDTVAQIITKLFRGRELVTNKSGTFYDCPDGSVAEEWGDDCVFYNAPK